MIKGLLETNKVAQSVLITAKSGNKILKNSKIYPYNGSEKVGTILACLSYENCLIDFIEIQKNIDKKDLGDIIELKVREELSLDPMTDYVIRYLPTPTLEDDSNTRYAVFAAKQSDIENCTQVRPLDFLGYAPLVISALFTKNFLPDTSNFGFLYMEQNEAFIAVYSGGNFIYCKGLQKLSLHSLFNRFCEICGERFSLDDIINLLIKDTLKLKRPDAEDTLKMFYSELFSSISDILLHAKRTYQLNDYGAIYIGSSLGAPINIEEKAKQYLNIKVKPFEFNVGIESKEYVDIITRLLPLYAQDGVNFSIFGRPPPFLRRDAGRLILATGIAVLIAALYPVVMFGPFEAYLKYRVSISSYANSDLNTQKQKLDSQITTLSNALKQNEQNLAKMKAEYDYVVKIVHDLAALKTDYTPRSVTIVQISQAVKNADVKLSKLDFNTTDVSMVCLARNPGATASLMQELTRLYNKAPSMPWIVNENGTYKAYITISGIGGLRD